MLSNREIRRRLDVVEGRVNWLDEHGTRGIEGVNIKLQEQSRDIADNTAKLTLIDSKVDGIAQARRAQLTSVVVALLPVYVLLFLSLFHVTASG